MKPRLIDVFSGGGLFSQGFRATGFEPILAVELDRHAVESYNLNIGNVAVCKNVLEIDALPQAEVLIAGPPCQGFSTLGRRDAADERNGLGLHIPGFAARAGVSVAIVENVPPFLHSRQWTTMAEEFQSYGFTVQTWVLDAVNFGAPQRRIRAFTVASRVGPLNQPIETNTQVPAGIAFAPTRIDDPLHTWPEPSLTAKKRMMLIPERGDKRDILLSAPELCPPSWARLGAQATDVWGRIDPSTPSNTLRCRFQNPSTGRYIHPTEDRVLSLREGARLQGVPDDWVFVGHATSIARQIGNGVPVPLATAVASSVMEVFSAVPTPLAA